MYGSDVVVDWLAGAGIDYVALNPGASLRGLHDSLVHADSPKPVVALHEEIAVAIAHGYAKSAWRPMAAFVHDLVGLQHASMAMFNAWVDNVPMLVIGGSGPRDTAKRRPWIDWVHSGLPQGALVRDFVKWDDEPASLEAVPASLSRALQLAQTAPMGPVYVSIDAYLQEQEAKTTAPMPDIADSAPVVAPADVIEDVARTLAGAETPVVLVDRPGPGSFAPLVEVVERIAASVVDLGGRCSFPSSHWGDQTAAHRDVLKEADVVLALEPRDLAWATTTLDLHTRRTKSLIGENTSLISVGLGDMQRRGFVDPDSWVPGVRRVVSDVAGCLRALVGMLDAADIDEMRIERRRAVLQARHGHLRRDAASQAAAAAGTRPIASSYLASCLWDAVREGPWQLANGHLGGWTRLLWDMDEESSYLGLSGGAGLGYGLPASLGAALAQRGSEVLVVDIQGDGDLLYTPQALWTAAHHNLPLLVVLYNNRSYGKDELHQTEMAQARNRGLEKVGVGIRIDGPAVDYAELAKSQGIEGIGPIEEPQDLQTVLNEAAHAVRNERRTVLVDVICARA
jgi:thiamine pyrophosphate-dependent acetolactate synthase large subunit-like protein